MFTDLLNHLTAVIEKRISAMDFVDTRKSTICLFYIYWQRLKVLRENVNPPKLPMRIEMPFGNEGEHFFLLISVLDKECLFLSLPSSINELTWTIASRFLYLSQWRPSNRIVHIHRHSFEREKEQEAWWWCGVIDATE